MKVKWRIWDVVHTWLFYLSIAQDQVWVSLKDGSMNFNPEKNSSLNACVLLRSCTKFVKPCTLNLYDLSCFAKGLAKT
jgi:hypothetical protein